jgi:dipeptidyl aminopeptidase/acylaminoacyl peptidase
VIRRSLVAWLLLLSLVRAAEPVRDHAIDVDDYFTLATVTQLAVSPDGGHVAYVEQRWEGDAEMRNADLWVVDVATKTRRRLTFDRAEEAAPRWSPDGRHLYFTAGVRRPGDDAPPHDGKTQVWRVAADGSGLQAVTRVKEGIGRYDLSADGRALYHTVVTEGTDEEWKDLRTRYKDLDYGHGVTKFTQVWRLDLESWRAEKLVDERRVVTAMSVSPDQSRIAMVTTPDDELLHLEGWSRVDVWNAATRTVETVTPEGWREDHGSPFGWIEGPAWSADGALAFAVDFDGHPCRVYACEWTGGKPRTWELRRPAGVSVIGTSLAWRGPARELCFLGEQRARARVHAIADVRGGGQGADRVLTPGDHAVSAFHLPASGTPLGVIDATVTDPPDVYLVRENAACERITKVNPQVDSWKLPRISLVQWQAPDGREVEGILELPPDAKPGERLPMVVEIHGGPTASSLLQLQYWIYGRVLLPAKGYAVLSPNYRGSTGYGDDFLEELLGRENDVEVADILSGVDACVARGIADPDRLGVMGWSNGGYLTNCLVARTDRFKAASSGAGVVDQVIQWGTEDTPGHVVNFMGGRLPWAEPDAYRAASPMYGLDRVRTPTLLHVGELDARVPAAHARAMYRALKTYLGVPTELVVYPGAGHGLVKQKHRRAKMEWDLAWFERHLRGTSQPTPPPAK